jgi:tRNA threonylcarbamoyl adenosine modification protein YeaZ
MKILAFDTSLGACSAAVAIGGRIVARLLEPMERGHAERVVPMIAEAMADAALALAELDLIAATPGPGTFTGIRVAVAAAEGLRLATGCPLCGTTSLAVMAAALGKDAEGRTIAVSVDARREETYTQFFAGGALRPLGEAQLLRPEEAARSLPVGRPIVAVGSAARGLVDAARPLGHAIAAGPAVPYPDAADLALLAPQLPRLNPLRPIYMRPPDAKPQAGDPDGALR